MKKEKHENCDCIFCNSKCPECGSKDIEVTYRPGFSYDNNFESRISFNRIEDEVELECKDCGERLEDNRLETDCRLDLLSNAMSRALQLPSELVVDINENGEIEITPYETVWRPISK